MPQLNRNRLILKTRLTTRLRQAYLIGSGSTLALAVLFGISVFFYGNFGSSKESKASGVTLLGFTAALINNATQVNVEWVTQAEVNNAVFDLQRSVNAQDYQVITEIPGKGTDSSMHQYSFVDTHPLSGVSYYRLKQINLDGTFSYSAIQSVNNEQMPTASSDTTKTVGGVNTSITPSPGVPTTGGMVLSPNPATSEITVAMNVTKELDTHIDILDLTGKLMLTRPVSFKEGQNEVSLPLGDLTNGIYMARYTNENDQVVTEKFMKQ